MTIGTIYVVEIRPSEGGRGVVCSIDRDGKKVDWTIKDHNCRTLVHEYGGTCCSVSNGIVYYSNFEDQRIYKQESPSSMPVAVSPESKKFRFADFVVDEKRGMIYSVLEDHSLVGDGVQYPTNSIASIDIKSGAINVLAEGCDFYIQPRLSPNGNFLAWVEWTFPNMPWSSTTLKKGKLNGDGSSFVSGSVTKSSW